MKVMMSNDREEGLCKGGITHLHCKNNTSSSNLIYSYNKLAKAYMVIAYMVISYRPSN